MNFAPTQPLRKSPRRRPAARVFIAFALITVVFTATTAQAGPVQINQVVQTLTTQGAVDLRISTLVQDPGSATAKPASGSQGNGPVAQKSGDAKLDALLAGFPIVQDPQRLGVEVVEEAEVEGTICDCGDVFVAAAGFPKWPLLFLTAVPLAFIDFNHDCDDCNNDSTPTPTPVPEPASLLLLGTGLMVAGAGLRRRGRNKK